MMRIRYLPALMLLLAACADEAPPTFPPEASLTVTPTVDGFEATWPTATDDRGVTTYLVRVDGQSPVQVAGTRYKGTGLEEATSHNLRVQAADAAGNDSTPLEADFKTRDKTPPYFAEWARAVANFGTTADSGLRVIWTHAADNAAVVDYIVRAGQEEVAVVPTGDLEEPMLLQLESEVTADTITIIARDAEGHESPPLTANLVGAKKARLDHESSRVDGAAQAVALAISAGNGVPVDSVNDPANAKDGKDPSSWAKRRRRLFNPKGKRREVDLKRE